MEYIVLNEVRYDIKSIKQEFEAVIRIEFADSVPVAYGSFELFTSGDYSCGVFSDYNTIYRDEGQMVYLSNDGSVYVVPETPEGPSEPPIPYEPTMDDLRASKRREVSADCEKIIYTGVSVGNDHFALTEKDQLNLFGKQAQIAAGVTQLEYHADGKPCRYFGPEEMLAIVQAAMWHVSYHTTYCNALNMWIAGTETAEELQAVFYGADVPEPYQSDVLKAYLLQIANMAEDHGA